ncbi:MAG TPA: flavin reductase family protein [Acidimicrobiales bacterium]|nr:flavin reductase family protein [Acidimicrobiales bacterium]
MSALDVAHFKEVLGRYATGVVVITALSPEGPVGFTSQTFGSLSLEPMLISFAATTRSTSWPKIRDIGVIGVNILRDDQESIARAFATSGIDKFANVTWSSGQNGAPLIEGALATLEGRVEVVATYGDHDVVVVAVDQARAQNGEPLLYYRGGFNVLA